MYWEIFCNEERNVVFLSEHIVFSEIEIRISHQIPQESLQCRRDTEVIWLEPLKYTIFPLQLCSFQILCAPLCASFQQLWHNEKSNIYLITLVMWSWQRRIGLLFCCHFWPLFSAVCWRGQARVWGQLPLCPILPSCPNFCCLSLWNGPLTWERRIGSSAQQVPAPWKPLFSPQNIPFCSFEDLSLCKASITRPRAQRDKAAFLPYPWLIKKLLSKNMLQDKKKWHTEERPEGEARSRSFPGNIRESTGAVGGREARPSMKMDYNSD